MTAFVYPPDPLESAVAPGVQVKPDVPTPDTWYASLEEMDGGYVANSFQEVTPVPVNYGSGYVASMFDDFYNRIHINPGVIDLGNVISGQFYNVYVWNGYLVDKSMTAHNPPTDQGITLSGQAAPYTMSALEELPYELTIDSNGPPTISSVATWTIGGIDLKLEITGTRIVDFLYRPNWKNGLRETFSWLTDIITSFDGSEQRRGLRTKPRRALEYTTVLTDDDLRNFQNKLYGWHNRPFAVPLWQDKTRLTAGAGVGDTQIFLDTTLRAFAKGALAIIRKSVREFEVVEIDDVSDSSLILTKGLTLAWDESTEVYPAIVAYLPQQLQTRRLTSNAMETLVRFEADPVPNKPELPDLAAQLTIDGYEVVTRKPNWAAPVEYESDQPYLEFDSEVGAKASTPSVDTPSLRRRMKWVMKDKADIHEFKGLLGRLKGRQKVALVPTWFPDMTVDRVIGSGASAIFVSSEGYSRFVGAAPGQEYLLIRFPDGTVEAHKITGTAEDVNGAISLSITPNTAVVLQPGTLVSVMHLCRFSSDDIELLYKTNGVVEVDVIMESKKA